MLGLEIMVWTAILEKDGVSSALCFRSGIDAKDALANIKSVVQCDGYKILGLMKGDHVSVFYPVDIDSSLLNSEETD